MAWITDVTRSVAHGVQGLATGVMAAVATPFVYRPLRPLTKQALKGGLWVARGAQSLVELTQSEWNDMVTEARAEVQSAPPPLTLDNAPSDGTESTLSTKTSSSAPATSESEQEEPKPSDDDPTAVKGIGDDYAELLQAAGVTSIAQLAAHDPDVLRSALSDANETSDIVGRVPSADRIKDWIEQAHRHAG
jgi:predicted flap endonuclease-1-like 5' DNA nuclease